MRGLRKKAIGLLVLSMLCVNYGTKEPMVSRAEEVELQHIQEEQIDMPTGGVEEPEGFAVGDFYAVDSTEYNASPSYTQDAFFEASVNDYGKCKLSTQEKTYYEELDKEVKRFIASGADALQTSDKAGLYYAISGVAFSDNGIGLEAAKHVFIAYESDHPSYYWLKRGYRYNASSLILEVRATYASAETRQKLDQEIVENAKRIVAEANNGSNPYEKVRILHDELVQAVDYAYKPGTKTPEDADFAHTIVGLLDDDQKTSVVCEGYADTFTCLLSYMKIKNVYIVGEAGGGHAWNAVSFDGGTTYYDVDVTWDDIGNNEISYMYFAMPHDRFKTSHTENKSSGTGVDWQYDLPTMGNDMEYTYFKKYGAYAENITNAEEFLQTAGALSPGTKTCILGDLASIGSIARTVGLGVYYQAKEYGLYYVNVDVTNYKVKKPIEAILLKETNAEVDRDDGKIYILKITSVSPSDTDDYLVISSSNASMAKPMKNYIKAEKDATVEIRLIRNGEVTITVNGAKGSASATCSLSIIGTATSNHIYEDAECTKDVTEESATVFTNGAKTKNSVGETRNYKSVTLYTDLVEPTYRDAKGKVKNGKVIVGITESHEQPLVSKNKIVTTKAAKDIAKVSYKKKDHSITVTAGKNAGVVYVWIITVTDKDTVCEVGGMELYVKAGAKKLELLDADANIYKKATVAIGEETYIYIRSVVDKAGTTAEECTYTMTAAKGMEQYVDIEGLDGSGWSVTGKGLKNGKNTTVKLNVICTQTNKKASFSLSIINPVISIEFDTAGDANITPLGKLGSYTVQDGEKEYIYTGERYQLKGSDTAKVTGSIKVSIEAADVDIPTTDKAKLYMLSSPEGFSITNGKLKVTSKPSGENSKWKAAFKNGMITVTAPKKLKDAKIYALLVYNTLGYDEGGFKIIELNLTDGDTEE